LTSFYLSPWRIDVSVRDGVTSPVSRRALAALAARALEAARAEGPASIALILSDDTELEELNVEHMGHEGPTDVLSFPMLPVSAFPPHPGQDPAVRSTALAEVSLPPGRRPHLGDVVVSIERAAAQAPAAPADELRLLVAHGVLHVCGWDHAIPEERDAMRALEARLLAGS
jgi:probable rRNA maturation factor